MRAVLYTRYGPPEVLHLREVEKPVPKNDEVLVRVRAASINRYDRIYMRGRPFIARLAGGGLLRPKHQILGSDIAGQVEAVGKGVKLFRPGDEVFGDIARSGLGGLAEFVCTKEDLVAPKPTNVSFQAAAATGMAAITALQALRDYGRTQSGQKILINGASGGVGTFAVQIAKSFGAEVTAVCSTRHLEVVRSIGSDHVIDYTKEDFTQNGQYYDLILGVNGYQPILHYKRALGPEGTYVMVGGKRAQIIQALLLGPLISMAGGKKMGAMGAAKPNKQDYAFLSELLESGKVRPVIDRQYRLNEAPEALRHLDGGRVRGKIVITVE